MKILTPEQSEALRKPLPKEAISQHPTKSYLSSIKAIYVVERLNQVFGIGSWCIKSEVIDSKTSMIVVRSTFTIPEYGIELESFGGNNNGGESSKNFDLGDAYKGATTDALTKICSYLEIGIDVFKGLGTTVGRPPYNPAYKTPITPVNYLGLLKAKLITAKNIDQAIEEIEIRTGVVLEKKDATKLENIITNEKARDLLDLWQK